MFFVHKKSVKLEVATKPTLLFPFAVSQQHFLQRNIVRSEANKSLQQLCRPLSSLLSPLSSPSLSRRHKNSIALKDTKFVEAKKPIPNSKVRVGLKTEVNNGLDQCFSTNGSRPNNGVVEFFAKNIQNLTQNLCFEKKNLFFWVEEGLNWFIGLLKGLKWSTLILRPYNLLTFLFSC